MSKKLITVPKLKSGLDEKVAEQFSALFHDAQNGMRRVVAFGMFAWQIKQTELKHGQFGPWVEANFAGRISYRSVRAHMQLTQSALEACGVKTMQAFFKLAAPLPFSHSGELLLMPEAKLPEEAKPLREKLCALLDGKSARALFTEFKQAEETEDEKPLRPKRGRIAGQGGASKEQRAAAAEREELERLTSLQLKADEVAEWLMEYADLKGFARIDDIPGGEKTLKALSDAVSYANNFFHTLKKSSK